MPAPSSRASTLPQKEQGAFRKVVKSYEQKQYRNGLRLANAILKSFPDHGETLSMKGLILNSQGKREEARECVKRGLRADINSHVCWHVFGLFHRSEKKYEEAIKAYRNALSRDKDNMQILRDLSLLQIQMRDLEGYKETRYTLLSLRPTQRASWIGYAMSYHLLQEHDTALRILSEFIKGQTEPKTPNSFQPSSFDFEHSELLLYQNLLLREAGKTTEALAHLNEHEFAILDKVQSLELKGELHIREGRRAVAAEVYRELIERNPDNRDYYRALESCMDLEREEAAEARAALFHQMETKYPRSSVPKVLPLSFLKGDAFRAHMEKYLRDGLRKGLPSLFQLIRSLYAQPDKAAVIGDIATRFKAELAATAHFPGAVNGSGEAGAEVPTTLLWALYFLAQHYDRVGESALALEAVDAALAHTPTLIELLTIKAKIFKHAGAVAQAAVCVEDAQSLDTADRFINCKAAKYLLRAGRIEEAEAMAGKFTREGMDPMANLNEMQCMWFESESAAAFYRLGMLGHALKKCHEMDRHFADIEEDQFDFHTYCVRRMTLCSYVRLLRLEDGLRTHPFYFKAARLAVKIYLRLHENPATDGGGTGNDAADAATAAELRKEERKRKKAAAKADASKKDAPKKALDKKADPDEVAAVVAPLDPKALLKVDKPLDEAVRFLTPLLDLNTPHIDAYIYGFHVYWHKEKALRMTQCLKRAHDLQPLYPKLHICKVRMLMFLEGKEFSGAVGEILTEELAAIFGSERSPGRLNLGFLAAAPGSFPHLLAAAEAAVLIDGGRGKSAELVQAVTKAVEAKPGATMAGLDLKATKRAQKLLRRGRLGRMEPVVLERFRASAATHFPLAEVFRSPEELRLASKTAALSLNDDDEAPVANGLPNAH